MTRHVPANCGLSAVAVYLGLAAGLFGCTDTTGQGDSRSTANTIPVEWTPELSTASLLLEMVEPNSQEDLTNLLSRRWYASIDVENHKTGENRTLNNCNDLFAVEEPNLHARQEPEHAALLEFKVMCEAARLLGQATPAQNSNISTNPLDASLPTRLPKSIALVTSQSEWQHIQKNRDITHWGDVYPINRAEQKSPHQTTYYSDGGVQTLSILGRGDINGDGANDILVTVKDTVEGGSYFNLRLFVFTVTAQGQWEVVAQY